MAAAGSSSAHKASASPTSPSYSEQREAMENWFWHVYFRRHQTTQLDELLYAHNTIYIDQTELSLRRALKLTLKSTFAYQVPSRQIGRRYELDELAPIPGLPCPTHIPWLDELYAYWRQQATPEDLRDGSFAAAIVQLRGGEESDISRMTSMHLALCDRAEARLNTQEKFDLEEYYAIGGRLPREYRRLLPTCRAVFVVFEPYATHQERKDFLVLLVLTGDNAGLACSPPTFDSIRDKIVTTVSPSAVCVTLETAITYVQKLAIEQDQKSAECAAMKKQRQETFERFIAKLARKELSKDMSKGTKAYLRMQSGFRRMRDAKKSGEKPC